MSAMTSNRMTHEELRSLPTTVDIETAARALGLSRNLAYRQARQGTLPVRCWRAGRAWRVASADLLALLAPSERMSA